MNRDSGVLGARDDAPAAPWRHGDDMAAERRAYEALVTGRIEERGLRIEARVSAETRALAERLAERRSTPREVLELHLGALRELSREASPGRSRALIDAGATVLIEALGELAACYRRDLEDAEAELSGTPARRLKAVD